MKNILVLHGPNLNLLGIREPSIYGAKTLQEIDSELQGLAQQFRCNLKSFQSNSESALIDAIHQAMQDNIDYMIINPAAFTHTSIGMRDALIASNISFIEVHLSNTYAREPWRKHSYFSDIAKGVIIGLAEQSYRLALLAVIELLRK